MVNGLVPVVVKAHLEAVHKEMTPFEGSFVVEDDDFYPWYSFHEVYYPLQELGYDTDLKYDYEIEERESELRELPDYGDHMTMEQFKSYVESCMFIDYDGSGNLATGDKCSGISIMPSYFAVEGYEIPEWATHVVWYNK